MSNSNRSAAAKQAESVGHSDKVPAPGSNPKGSKSANKRNPLRKRRQGPDSNDQTAPDLDEFFRIGAEEAKKWHWPKEHTPKPVNGNDSLKGLSNKRRLYLPSKLADDWLDQRGAKLWQDSKYWWWYPVCAELSRVTDKNGRRTTSVARAWTLSMLAFLTHYNVCGRRVYLYRDPEFVGFNLPPSVIAHHTGQSDKIIRQHLHQLHREMLCAPIFVKPWGHSIVAIATRSGKGLLDRAGILAIDRVRMPMRLVLALKGELEMAVLIAHVVHWFELNRDGEMMTNPKYQDSEGHRRALLSWDKMLAQKLRLDIQVLHRAGKKAVKKELLVIDPGETETSPNYFRPGPALSPLLQTGAPAYDKWLRERQEKKYSLSTRTLKRDVEGSSSVHYFRGRLEMLFSQVPSVITEDGQRFIAPNAPNTFWLETGRTRAEFRKGRKRGVNTPSIQVGNK